MAKKEIKNFKSLDALQSVVNIVNEAGEAVKDKGVAAFGTVGGNAV